MWKENTVFLPDGDDSIVISGPAGSNEEFDTWNFKIENSYTKDSDKFKSYFDTELSRENLVELKDMLDDVLSFPTSKRK
jgi:uncharacterized radical SAM superfamily protein